MQCHTWYYRYYMWYYMILYDTIYIYIIIIYTIHYKTDIVQRQRNTEPPKSLLVSSAHALLLCSGAQINGMTLTGAADPAAGFSGMVRSGAKWWSGHGSGVIFLTMWRWQSSWTPNISSWIVCEMPRISVIRAVTVTVTSKEQWISSFASFSRWRPRDIIFGQAQATEHAMSTHRVSFHEWSGSQQGGRQHFV